MPTLNYTTTIKSDKTIAECQVLLAKHGASAVVTHFENGRAAGLSFTLTTAHGPRAFTLPVDVPAVHKLLLAQVKSRSIRPAFGSLEQAERTAWRVIKDWLAAQLALIEAQMATIDQVMLPYLHIDGDKTLYAAYVERENAALAITAGVSEDFDS